MNENFTSSLEAEICGYTRNIWSSVLGLEVTIQKALFQPTGKEDTLAGCIHIMGAWEGAIAPQCPKGLARRAAAIMFEQQEDQIGTDLIQDALAEITNMTGGNIKALLPGPCTLSLPAVAITDYNFRIPGTQLETLVTFDCQGQNFAVSIHRKINGMEDGKPDTRFIEVQP